MYIDLNITFTDNREDPSASKATTEGTETWEDDYFEEQGPSAKKPKTDNPTTSVPTESSNKRPAAADDLGRPGEQQGKRLKNTSSSIAAVHPTTTATPAPATQQQTDTDRGRATNTKGSVQGEAGSRKPQAIQGAVFGLIQVSYSYIMSKLNDFSKTYVWAFKEKKFANEYAEFVEYLWSNALNNIVKLSDDNFNFENFDKRMNVEKKINEVYIVATTLPFNIKFKTLQEKLKMAIDKERLHFSYVVNLVKLLPNNEDIENDEVVEEKLIHILKMCMNLGDFGFDIADEIAKEEARLNYTNKRYGDSSDTAMKKRKRARFDD